MFKLGDLVRTPASLPTAWGRITRVYEEGKFYEVEKRYGNRHWRRKYTLETLFEAQQEYERIIKDRRERAKKYRQQRSA